MYNIIDCKITQRAVFITILILLLSMCFAAAPAYAASKGAAPVAHWRFDEGGGATAYDDSSNNNDGTLSGGSTFVNGKVGKALSFNGSTGHVTANDTTCLRQGNDWTISGWVYARSTSGYDKIVIGKQGWHGGIIWLGSTMQFAIYNTAGSRWAVSYTPNLNTWYHYEAVYTSSSGNMKFYVNGALAGTETFNTATTMNYEGVNALYIGGSGDANYHSNVMVDDARIYNYARTAEQVMVDYNAGSASYLGSGADPNEGNPPVAYWKLDENTGTTAYDRSGNGNNGTLTNSPTWAQGKYGTCLKFVTDSENAVIPASSTINFGTSDFSVAAWVNINQPQTYGSGILGRYPHDTGYNGNFVVGILDDTTSLFFFHRNTSGAAESYGYDYRPYFGRWVYMAWVKSGTKLYLYLNGELKQSWTPSISFDVTFTGRDYRISDTGWSPGTMSNLMVDEHKLYNYARSAAQIAYDYNKGKPIAHYKFDEGGGVIAHNEASSADTGTAPVGWWRFDESSGTSSADASGNGNTATLAAAPAAPTWSASSKIGPYTLSFDGGDSVSVPQVLSGNSAFTAEAWVNPGDTTTAWKTVFAEGCSGFDLAINNAVINFGRNCGGGNGFYTGPTVSADTWYHLALVFDGTNLNLYTNGAKTTGGPSVYAHAPLYIGSYNGSNELFVGKIDDVRIYNYARTPEQIYNDYKTTHGTLVGDTKFTDGKIGKALEFDGTGDYVEIADEGITTDPPAAITLSSWVKLTNKSTEQTIISKPVTNNWNGPAYARYILRYDQTQDKWEFWTESYSRVLRANSVPTAGVWTHLVATYDGSVQRIYVNGVLDNSSSVSGAITDSTENLAIGSHGSSGNTGEFLNGLIDDVKIYNYARTAEQVLQDYNAGVPARLGAQSAGVADPWGGALPVAQWKLDENTGVLAYDSSGNGYNGTLGADGAGSDVPVWTQGKFGSGLSFDGGDNVQAPLAVTQTDNWTIMAWAKSNTTSGSGGVVQVGGPGCVGYSITRSGGNWMPLYPCVDWNAAITSVTVGQWIHLAVVRENGSMKAYANGVQTQSGDASVPLSPSGNYITLGAAEGGYLLNGSIDDVKIYNYARTQAQIAWDYNRGKPVAHWRMDEATSGSAVGTNNIKDNSGNAYHGSGSGTNIAWTTGKYGGGVSFNGTDDYVRVNQTLSTPITASCWVKLTDFSKTANTFINSNPHTVLGISLNRTGIGDIYVYIGNGTSWLGAPGIISSSNMVVNRWHHVSYTCNGTTSTLYLDGISVGSVNTVPSGWGSYFNFGGIVQGGEYLKGSMDDARIYTYARTAEQVMQDYNQGLAARTGD